MPDGPSGVALPRPRQRGAEQSAGRVEHMVQRDGDGDTENDAGHARENTHGRYPVGLYAHFIVIEQWLSNQYDAAASP